MLEDKQGNKKALIRNKIKERLIEATTDRLSSEGLQGIRARDLANDAQCAVGTLYNVAGSLDNLILLACSNTLKEFWVFINERFECAKKSGKKGEELLLILSEAYIDFYKKNQKRWQANFEISYDRETEYFKIYNDRQRKFLIILVDILKEVAPHENQRELFCIARALWASVHGICAVGIANTSNMMPKEKILARCKRIIRPVLKNLEMKEAS